MNQLTSRRLVLSLAATLAAGLAACTTEPTLSSANRPIIETLCASDAECPTGFECEIEEEHGVTTSYCQAHDELGEGSGSAACPAGYELEIEHGQAYCKLHGEDDGAGSGSDDNAGSTGTGTTGAACATDAECAVGYECELQTENGVTTGTCQAHGGV